MASEESTTPEGGAAEDGAERLRALVIVSGPRAALAALIELLAGLGDVTVQGALAVPGEAEEPLPHPLTAKERAIIEHDLRGSARRLIAADLDVTPDTITAYRRLIRIKLRAIPPERCPAWAQSWLRRFPGGPPGRAPRA